VLLLSPSGESFYPRERGGRQNEERQYEERGTKDTAHPIHFEAANGGRAQLVGHGTILTPSTPVTVRVSPLLELDELLKSISISQQVNQGGQEIHAAERNAYTDRGI
jgi:hypothetical protein